MVPKAPFSLAWRCLLLSLSSFLLLAAASCPPAYAGVPFFMKRRPYKDPKVLEAETKSEEAKAASDEVL